MTATSRLATALALAALATTTGWPGAPGPAAVAAPGAEHHPATAGATVATLRLDGLARGAGPRVPFVRGAAVNDGDGTWQLVRPGGGRVALPRAGWGAFTTVGRRVVGGFDSEAGAIVQVVDPRGDVHTYRGRAHLGLATTPDHSVAGWLDAHGRPATIQVGRTRPLRLGPVARARTLGALTGVGTCQEREPEGGGCTAFVNQDGHRATYTSSHGITDRVPGVALVTDASASGRITVVPRDDRGCSAVRSFFRELWRTCQVRLQAFAPHGHRVLGTRGAIDPRRVAVLDARGHLLRAWRVRRGSGVTRFSQVTWEDPTHLLAVVRYRGAWRIVRLGIDGSREWASGRRATGGVDDPAFRLPLA